MSQSERIFFIDRKLRNNENVIIQDIAEHFEISTRQVKRDIEYLRDRFCAPIVYDKKNLSYKYEHTFNALKFADQKLVLFYVAMKSLCENEHYIPIYTDDMLANLQKDIPRDYLEVCDKISYQLPRQGTINSDFFMDICDSIREKKTLEISYKNIQEIVSERIIEPEHLISYDGNWYIICFDLLREKIITLLLSRIISVKKTKNSFHTPEKNYELKLKNYLSDSYGIFKGDKIIEAKIQFTGKAAQTLQTTTLHPKQKISIFKDYLELTLPIANFIEISQRILSFGAEAIPIYPPELVSTWKDEIQKLAKVAL